MREERLLLIETAHRQGFVAIANEATILGQRMLHESRRHCRDLTPRINELLDEQCWTARDLAAVVVSRGPGSYTGLRVGIMSAKTLAWATGCTLLAVDTFAAIARQAPAEAGVVDVIADAQQDKIYLQRFQQNQGQWTAAGPLAIEAFESWVATLDNNTWVSGPGLELFEARLPAQIPRAPNVDWIPSAASLLHLGLEKWRRGERDDVLGLEPLYLRASAAEEKWATPQPPIT